MTKNLERQITIQPANSADGSYDVHKPLPYPYHIGEGGLVGRQDFWAGEPAALVGFQNDPNVQHVDVHFTEFWDNPQIAVGKYPVLVDHDGGMWNHTHPISDVSVHAVTETSEVL